MVGPMRERDVAEDPAILFGNIGVERGPCMIPAEGLTLLNEEQFEIRLALRQRQCAEAACQAAAGDD